MQKLQTPLRFDAFRRNRGFPNLKTGGLFGNPAFVLSLFGVGFLACIWLGFVVQDGLVSLFFLATPFAFYLVHLSNLARKRTTLIMRKFAEDNNLQFSEEPDYHSSGVIFTVGNYDHQSSNVLRGQLQDYPITLYWHTFSAGSGRFQNSYHYAVVELELPKPLPHIFLDNRRNNSEVFQKEALDIFADGQLLELEGDFSKYFRIYANKKQAPYTLTILNPAFMQALVKRVITYDIELVGNRAFLYFPHNWGPGAQEIQTLWESARFLAKELEKQLDTFRPDKNNEELQRSGIKRSLTSWR